MTRDLVLLGDLSSRININRDTRPAIEKIAIFVSELLLVLSARASNWGWNQDAVEGLDVVGGLTDPPGSISGGNNWVITNIDNIEQISTIRHVSRDINRFNCFMNMPLNRLNVTSFP